MKLKIVCFLCLMLSLLGTNAQDNDPEILKRENIKEIRVYGFNDQLQSIQMIDTNGYLIKKCSPFDEDSTRCKFSIDLIYNQYNRIAEQRYYSGNHLDTKDTFCYYKDSVVNMRWNQTKWEVAISSKIFKKKRDWKLLIKPEMIKYYARPIKGLRVNFVKAHVRYGNDKKNSTIEVVFEKNKEGFVSILIDAEGYWYQPKKVTYLPNGLVATKTVEDIPSDGVRGSWEERYIYVKR